jgi:transcriptional regulator with XRE-family HTH domain
MNLLAERIKQVMDEQNIQTAAQLAKIARVTNQAVSQWVNNSTKTMDAKAAFRLQKLYGYSAEWLFDGTGPKRLDDAAREQTVIYALNGNHLDLRLLNPLAAEIIRTAYQTALRLDGATL